MCLTLQDFILEHYDNMPSYIMFVHGEQHSSLPCWLPCSAAPAARLPVLTALEEEGLCPACHPPQQWSVAPAGLHLGHMLPHCLQPYACTGTCGLDWPLQPTPALFCCDTLPLMPPTPALLQVLSQCHACSAATPPASPCCLIGCIARCSCQLLHRSCRFCARIRHGHT